MDRREVGRLLILRTCRSATELANDHNDHNDQDLEIGNGRGMTGKWDWESSHDMDMEGCSSPTLVETRNCSNEEQGVPSTRASRITSLDTLRVRAMRFYRERLRSAKQGARRFFIDLQLEVMIAPQSYRLLLNAYFYRSRESTNGVTTRKGRYHEYGKLPVKNQKEPQMEGQATRMATRMARADDAACLISTNWTRYRDRREWKLDYGLGDETISCKQVLVSSLFYITFVSSLFSVKSCID